MPLPIKNFMLLVFAALTAFGFDTSRVLADPPFFVAIAAGHNSWGIGYGVSFADARSRATVDCHAKQGESCRAHAWTRPRKNHHAVVLECQDSFGSYWRHGAYSLQSVQAARDAAREKLIAYQYKEIGWPALFFGAHDCRDKITLRDGRPMPPDT